MNNRGFSTIETVLVITFIGVLTLFASKAAMKIKTKKLDFIVSEIHIIMDNNDLSYLKSNFNQDTVWTMVNKEYNNTYDNFFEITRYGNTNLFSKKDILYILQHIGNDKIYLTNNKTIISIEAIDNYENNNDKIYGITIKK